jgi:cytoskeletal protein CcmA (bactofilin family)
MLNRKKQGKIDPATTDTLIGEGTSLEGDIKSQASIRLEGRIKGNIECEGDVIIGEKGEAISDISARNVTIAGSVFGNVTTTEKLTITSIGRLHGNACPKILVIEEGGVLMGTSQMNSEVAAASEEKHSEDEPADDELNQAGPV